MWHHQWALWSYWIELGWLRVCSCAWFRCGECRQHIRLMNSWARKMLWSLPCFGSFTGVRAPVGWKQEDGAPAVRKLRGRRKEQNNPEPRLEKFRVELEILWQQSEHKGISGLGFRAWECSTWGQKARVHPKPLISQLRKSLERWGDLVKIAPSVWGRRDARSRPW